MSLSDINAPGAWLVAAVLLLVAAVPSAGAAQTNLADLEDEVMCPICGTLLELSNSPQAERQRVFIERLVARGADEREIKDALVAEYGREVLATPEGSGFQLSAYLVPAVAFVVAALALALGLRRWRRAGDRDPDRPGAARPPAEDDERLDADLARYDL
ncbi:MAG TPA: cytochrome c-type biogenesis protein CcmH [Solirubrobacterales bacterium]|nr:cytochrome c-type biogenesis protein CcmH [Solirubrobacterales bacterium]